MLNSNERMGFIIEYMSSYDEKIKMANKNGLFDAAKMFELFAIEVCNVWFGQKFKFLYSLTFSDEIPQKLNIIIIYIEQCTRMHFYGICFD